MKKERIIEGYFIKDLHKMPFWKRWRIALAVLFKNESTISKLLEWMEVKYWEGK